MSCCFGPVFPCEVITEPVVELHVASLNCTVQCDVESPEDQVVCISVLCRFWKGNMHGKITW